MPALNIFKLFPTQIENLQNSLVENRLEFIQQIEKEHDEVDFSLKLYFNQNAPSIPIKWISDLAQAFKIESKKSPHYSAAVIITFKDQAFAVSFGSAHIYISKFADLDFGIDIACRLLSSFKIKSSREVASSRIKSIDTYKLMSELPFEAGEAVEYIRGIPLDIAVWGRNISCGHSVHLRHRKFNIGNSHLICKRLVDVLTHPISKEIPRRTIITKQDEIDKLDAKLIQTIDSGHNMVDISQAQLSGVAFIFPEISDYALLTPKQEFILNDDLDLATLKQIVQNDFDGNYDNLLSAEVSIRSDEGTHQSATLKDVLDYKDEDGHYLENGKWHKFDLTYLKTIRLEVDKIDSQHSEEMLKFDKVGYAAWKNQTAEKVNYPERYLNISLAKDFGYEDGDRSLLNTEGAKIEIADLYRDETIFIVKIGEPQKLNYAIDQAVTALTILERNSFTTKVNGADFQVKKVCLWLFIKRKKEIAQISEINSLIFLTKLAAWRKFTLLRGRIPMINISYSN